MKKYQLNSLIGEAMTHSAITRSGAAAHTLIVSHDCAKETRNPDEFNCPPPEFTTTVCAVGSAYNTPSVSDCNRLGGPD